MACLNWLKCMLFCFNKIWNISVLNNNANQKSYLFTSVGIKFLSKLCMFVITFDLSSIYNKNSLKEEVPCFMFLWYLRTVSKIWIQLIWNIWSTYLKWTKWMKLLRKNFFPQMSASQCDQLNEGVNTLTRKPFLWQNFLFGNIFVYQRGYLFYFPFMEAY